MVAVRRPGMAGTVDVSEAALPHYVAGGWERADAPADAPAEAPPTAKRRRKRTTAPADTAADDTAVADTAVAADDDGAGQ